LAGFYIDPCGYGFPGSGGFGINIFLAIDRHSHSVSDTLFGVFPFFACTFLLVDWLARSTSRSNAPTDS
jgi:hypothetical protein